MPPLDQIGLAASIGKHAAAFRERVKIDLTVQCHLSSENRLDGECGANLFHIAQEALHDIEKHARASQARINLPERDGSICLEMADNGCSFHPERVEEVQTNGHLGLVSMRERAKILGGTFEIGAQEEGDVLVRTVLPLRK